jgi:hypothetical protein
VVLEVQKVLEALLLVRIRLLDFSAELEELEELEELIRLRVLLQHCQVLYEFTFKYRSLANYM